MKYYKDKVDAQDKEIYKLKFQLSMGGKGAAPAEPSDDDATNAGTQPASAGKPPVSGLLAAGAPQPALRLRTSNVALRYL